MKHPVFALVDFLHYPSLIPHDIILADIGAVLYLDDLERDEAGGF